MILISITFTKTFSQILVFVDPGINVNGEYYKEMLL